MANYSVCGIDCDTCKFKKEQNCKGCKVIKGKVFCVTLRLIGRIASCAACAPLFLGLKKWASSENPERIDNLRKL